MPWRLTQNPQHHYCYGTDTPQPQKTFLDQMAFPLMQWSRHTMSACVFEQAMGFGSTALSPATAGTTIQTSTIQSFHAWILLRRSKQTMAMLGLPSKTIRRPKCRNCQETINKRLKDWICLDSIHNARKTSSHV